MSKKNIVKTIMFTLIISFFVILLNSLSFTNIKPQELYGVYFEGKMLGFVNEKDDLYNMIDKEQENLKKQYSVDKIYPPSSLTLTPITTFNTNILDVNNLYNIIKETEPFTIDGYEVTIEKETPVVFNILNKNDLDAAIKQAVLSFVQEDELNSYVDSTQKLDEDGEGVIIDNIYIEENITIKKSLISTSELILTNTNDISRYLLFGTLEPHNTYVIKTGESISDVAFKNKLSVNEFLIVNPELVSENALLFPGQIVNVDPINPIFTIVIEETKTELKEINYDTTVTYDNTVAYGTTKVKQKGEKGITKTTVALEYKNGFNTKGVTVSTTEISPVVNEIIVKGGFQTVYVGDSDYWSWPTLQPYCISSGYGYRSLFGAETKWHPGIDIACVAHGSPIFAVQNGVVQRATTGYNGGAGNMVVINHNNGYYTVYYHLSGINVSVGETVTKGSTIGFMGDTGYSFGTHLHFGVYKGNTNTGNDINPWLLYQ